MKNLEKFAVLLVSTLFFALPTTAQIVRPHPVCPVVKVMPAMDIRPGWEIGRGCAQQVVRVSIYNPGSCMFPGVRIVPAPHSTGANFYVFDRSIHPSRVGCGSDPVFVRPAFGMLYPRAHMEFTVFADRPTDLMVESVCRITGHPCSFPIHIETLPGVPNPYLRLLQPPPEPTTPDPLKPYELPGGGGTGDVPVERQ